MRERRSLKQAAKWVCALDRALAAEIAQEVFGDELPEMIRREGKERKDADSNHDRRG